jgi:hypothetical protein
MLCSRTFVWVVAISNAPLFVFEYFTMHLPGVDRIGSQISSFPLAIPSFGWRLVEALGRTCVLASVDESAISVCS